MSESQRKYQRVEGWWVYVIKTPDNMYYPGYSGGEDGKKQCGDRWQPSLYKGTALYSYIDQYGWDNLEKIVVVDGLTENEAVKWEGVLINMYCSIGCCINKQHSGYIYKSDIKTYNREYMREYRQQPERKAYTQQYNRQRNQQPEVKEYHRQYNQQYRQQPEVKEYHRQYRQQPEMRVYYRVKDYNRYHTPIETPLQAKQKYLETGYIPSYIKSDDLLMKNI